MQGQDLASGNLTAPALYALAGAHGPELLALIESEFTAEGGLPRAINLVNAGGGITSARALARREADLVRTQQTHLFCLTLLTRFLGLLHTHVLYNASQCRELCCEISSPLDEHLVKRVLRA